MWLVLASVAEASSLTRIPELSELRDRSHAVVAGVVLDVATERVSYGLLTSYTVAVDRTLAGAGSDVVTVRLPGGREGDLVQSFSDVPRWHAGDHVIVFVPREGGRQSLAGVFTVDGDRVIDPLERWAEVPSVDEVEALVAAEVRVEGPR